MARETAFDIYSEKKGQLGMRTKNIHLSHPYYYRGKGGHSYGDAVDDGDGANRRSATFSGVRQVVVLLHGVGSNGHDLIALAPHLSKAMPHALFLSPHAPFPFDAVPYAPSGQDVSRDDMSMMRQWFSLANRDPSVCMAAIADAAPLCDRYLDTVLQSHRIDPSRLFLFGFSQGAMMAMYVAMRRQVGGVCAFSGAPPGNFLPSKGVDASRRAPVLMVHGRDDPVVPYDLSRNAGQCLESAGFAVDCHFPDHLGHTIDGDGMAAAMRFFQRHGTACHEDAEGDAEGNAENPKAQPIAGDGGNIA